MSEEQITSELFASDEDFAALVLLFLRNLPEQLREAREAFESGTLSLLAQRAHKIAGAAALYGYPGLSETARTVEKEANSGSDSVAETLARMEALATKGIAGSRDQGLRDAAERIGTEEKNLDVLLSLVDLFIEEHLERVAAIEDAILQKNSKTLYEEASALRQMMKDFGAKIALDALETLANLGSRSEFEGADAALDVLKAELRKVE